MPPPKLERDTRIFTKLCNAPWDGFVGFLEDGQAVSEMVDQLHGYGGLAIMLQLDLPKRVVPEGLDSLVRNPSPLDDSQLNRCFARFRRARGSCFGLQRASFGNDERPGRSLGAWASAAASCLLMVKVPSLPMTLRTVV